MEASINDHAEPQLCPACGHATVYPIQLADLADTGVRTLATGVICIHCASEAP